MACKYLPYFAFSDHRENTTEEFLGPKWAANHTSRNYKNRGGNEGGGIGRRGEWRGSRHIRRVSRDG